MGTVNHLALSPRDFCVSPKMERWSGRVALVTGASVGIGAAICEMLVKHGLKVVGCAKRVHKIQELSEKLSGPGTLTGIKCDLTETEEINAMFEEIKRVHGGVDICINNAGYSGGSSLLNVSVEEMRGMLDVNVVALTYLTQLSINNMKERNVEEGHVININSMSGHRIPPGSSKTRYYSATKAAVNFLTEGFRQEVRDAKLPIRIGQLCPGVVVTEFLQTMTGCSAEEAGAHYEKTPALTAEDMANAVQYMIESPKHMQIHDIMVRPTDQTF